MHRYTMGRSRAGTCSLLATMTLAAVGGCERSQPKKPTTLPPTTERRADGSTEATPTSDAPARQPAATDAAPPANPHAADPPANPHAAPARPANPHAADPSTMLPPGHPPLPTQNDAPPGGTDPVRDGVLSLDGVKLTVPEGWVSKPVTPGGMGPVAVFELPGADGAGAAEVRITHFPGMKGMDEPNINRWLGQVLSAEGQPVTRDEADISVETFDGVTLTLVDVSGSVPASGAMMGGAGARIEDGRMIAAIVDHDMGPHYVKVNGPAATVERWSDAITAFLKSSQVTAP